MIVFDLRCDNAHIFEVWFRSSADYADQRARGLVACPICGNTSIAKAVMAPNVGAKGNRGTTAMQADPGLPAPAGTKHDIATLDIATLAAMQARLLEKSEWVGTAFTDRARAMHLGDEPAGLIHGQASIADARGLLEDGIAVAPLLVPIIPPEARN